MFFADTFKLFRKWLTFRPVCAASLFRCAALIWTLVVSIIGLVCVLTGVYIYGNSVIEYAMVLLSGLFLFLVLISLAALRRARKDQKAAGIKPDIRDYIGKATLLASIFGILMLIFGAKAIFMEAMSFLLRGFVYVRFASIFVFAAFFGGLGMFLIVRGIALRYENETFYDVIQTSNRHVRAIELVALLVNIPLLCYCLASPISTLGQAFQSLAPFLPAIITVLVLFIVVFLGYSLRAKYRYNKYSEAQLRDSIAKNVDRSQNAFFDSDRQFAREEAARQQDILYDVQNQAFVEQRKEMRREEKQKQASRRADEKAAEEEFRKSPEFAELVERSKHDIYLDAWY